MKTKKLKCQRNIIAILLLTAIFLSACGARTVQVTAPVNEARVVSSPASSPLTEIAAVNDYLDFDIEDFYDPNDTWAIYWYLCGSDLESQNGFASADLAEMMNVDLPDNITVVIETGGSNYWHEFDIDANSNSRYTYTGNGFELVEKIPRANMGDSKTLENFLRFCNENYPADHRAVIFWNHGGGSMAGIAFDELYDMDSLLLPEVRSALLLTAQLDTANPHYELIGFDACLMATVETANTLKGFARWMVASQELEPGCGWEYEELFRALAERPGMHGGDWGRIIGETYLKGCRELENDDYATLSVIDIAKIEEVIEALDIMGAEALYLAGNSTSFIGKFGRNARNVLNFGGNTRSEGFTNMIDIGDLVNKSADLLPYSKPIVQAALDNAVYYKINGKQRTDAGGLSCYYKFDGDIDDFYNYHSLGISKGLAYYYDYVLFGKPSPKMYSFYWQMEHLFEDYHNFRIDPFRIPSAADFWGLPLEKSDNSKVFLNVGSDLALNLSEVSFVISAYDEISDVVFILGFDNDLTYNWDRGFFSYQFDGTWGMIDGSPVYMEFSGEANGRRYYVVPILLDNDIHVLTISYSISSKKYEILGARRIFADTGMADGEIRLLVPGDIINPVHFVGNIGDSFEDYIPVGTEAIVITENTRFDKRSIGDGTFICMFEMIDVRNNSYFSEPIIFTVRGQRIY
ncbi:MAG: clostripain-related cysteine peptidase [Lachnospiraceae bacterium]|nr:clostripain-related cysteine peptidase [Lachnospiraceae bacterium]